MLKNYINIAWRHLVRQKGFAVINIAGLAVGLACCILIMIMVVNELSYDRFNKNADRIYRLALEANFGTSFKAAFAMAPAGPKLVEEYPEVIQAARFSYPGSYPVQVDNTVLQQDGISYADNSLFELFTFEFVKGNPANALTNPYTVVLTEEVAEKYFGDSDPVGKFMKIDGSRNYEITGVIKKLPANSHFQLRVIRSMATLVAERPQDMAHWLNIEYFTYLLLAEGADYKVLEGKLDDFIDRHLGETLKASGATVRCWLQPLTDIHLHSSLSAELMQNNNLMTLYLSVLIALFILLMACFNFINLATARSSTRMKEIGMRKTLGANRSKLIWQFLLESIIVSLLALLLALLLVEISLPLYNTIVGKELALDRMNPLWTILTFIGFSVVVGLLAGLYPALYLSRFQPIDAIRSGFLAGLGKARFRGSLVMFQFAISIGLMSTTIIIYNQLHFARSISLGMDAKHVLVISNLNEEIRQNIDSVKEEFESIPGVLQISATAHIPSKNRQISIVYPEGFSNDQPQTVDLIEADAYFLETMGMTVKEGRKFLPDLKTDLLNSVIINETAAKQFGWENPLGKKISGKVKNGTGFTDVDRTVVGVVRDFHNSSVHHAINPTLIGDGITPPDYLTIRLSDQGIGETIAGLESKWKKLAPDRPFNYFFLDESFINKYQPEEQLAKVLLFFTLLAIFIGCLGLVGISAYAAEQRKKEIGVRKVMGASVFSIIRLFNKEFILLILTACILAIPVAWYAAMKWLENYAYRIDVAPWVFIVSVSLAIIITIATVSILAFRTATANPVDSLRYE